MLFVQNFPFFGILLTLICAVVTSVLKGRQARWLTMALITAVTVMTGAVLTYTLVTGESYVYMMGHFPAPWGNEIRIGVVEALMMMVFCFVTLFAFIGGMVPSIREIEKTKYNIYCILVDLTFLALQALVYTNDLFTAYVFIEINTLAAAGLIMMRQKGRNLVAGVRYMMMNLVGSSLFLFGISILYTITGHLLMENIHDSVAVLAATGEYHIPLTIVVALVTVGLAVKSALYPFEKWLPGAYSNATPTVAAMLSSLVSKGYIFLLIKFYVRVIGFDVICSMGVLDVLFVFGLAGMIMGSINAVRAKTTRLMIAYSSVAQIGYIFTALGLRSEIGLVCALWHSAAHAATKSMLFVSCAEMDDACGGTHMRKHLRGAFYHSPLLALAFSLGAINLTGIPLLSVFMTKVTLTQAAIDVGGRHMGAVLIAVAISTLLNAVYFLGTAVNLFTPTKEGDEVLPPTVRKNPFTSVGLIGLIALNLAMGLLSQPFLTALAQGLACFA
ncbi:MAG: proton-conducting transporter membrane subunit [Christensenellales bacterium]|nr:proton-conducting transporter membrane subunit [Christensenellales bacterium]